MSIKQNKAIIVSALLFSIAVGPVFSQSNISVHIEDGWVIASMGIDESSQVLRVRIWGSTRIAGKYYQLDTDTAEEYVVVSRGVGSGPYYKLQIIDFRPNGIVTWSYDSSGVPRIENGLILLGSLPKGYQGAATEPVYEKFSLSVNGLEIVDDK